MRFQWLANMGYGISLPGLWLLVAIDFRRREMMMAA